MPFPFTSKIGFRKYIIVTTGIMLAIAIFQLFVDFPEEIDPSVNGDKPEINGSISGRDKNTDVGRTMVDQPDSIEIEQRVKNQPIEINSSAPLVNLTTVGGLKGALVQQTYSLVCLDVEHKRTFEANGLDISSASAEMIAKSKIEKDVEEWVSKFTTSCN